VEVEDASLIMVGKLFSWTLDVSTATVDSTVVISSSGVDENLVSLVNPIVLDEFFVKSVKVIVDYIPRWEVFHSCRELR
jgi:hypothetical protein